MDTQAVVNRRSATVRMSGLPVFDLKCVMMRVAKENPEWSQDRLHKAEGGYRQYLAKVRESLPKVSFRPKKDVDKVWHSHILHTREYSANCQDYFGYFLHHVPERGGSSLDVGECDSSSCSSRCTGTGPTDVRKC